MRKLFITLALFLTMLFVSSCATDSVVVYREYPSSPYYYHYYRYYGPTYYTYHYPYTYHHHGYHYHHNPPKPHNNHPSNHQPAVPPKPTNVPKATVRPNGNTSSGSMGGTRSSSSGTRSGRNSSGRR